MRRRGWSGSARRGIHDRNGVFCIGRIFDVSVVGSEGLRVVVLGTIVLLVLTFGLLLFVELALVLLVFGDTSLEAIG